jgi:hypothetical protein
MSNPPKAKYTKALVGTLNNSLLKKRKYTAIKLDAITTRNQTISKEFLFIKAPKIEVNPQIKTKKCR